jgi:hypothetical protein
MRRQIVKGGLQGLQPNKATGKTLRLAAIRRPGSIRKGSEELRNAFFQHHHAVFDASRARFLLQKL